MKLALIILGVIAVIAILIYSYRRSAKLSAQNEIYNELKTLPAVAKDFSTPEGAILCLEEAYRHHDTEAAIAAKDFRTEARLMLENKISKTNIDEEMISKLADALDTGYREEIKGGWPSFDGLECFFTKRESQSDNLVIVTEVCHFPDGGFSTQRLQVSKTEAGWRVLNVVK